MAYNKTSEERKWNYWKEQEEKKLRELGMEEEKIQKLRQMDREDFLEERRFREHLDEMMQDMDSIKQRDRGRFAQDIRELLDNIGDRRIYELLKGTEHQTYLNNIPPFVYSELSLQPPVLSFPFFCGVCVQNTRSCWQSHLHMVLSITVQR